MWTHACLKQVKIKASFKHCMSIILFLPSFKHHSKWLIYHIATYKFSRYVNFKDSTDLAFSQLYFEDHQPFENSRISLTNVLHTWHHHSLPTVATSIKNEIKKSTFGDTLSHLSGLMYQNCPQSVSQSTTKAIQNGLKTAVIWKMYYLAMVQLDGESGGHFRDCLNGCSCQSKACSRPLQVSDVAVQVYPALQLMQATVLPIKFWG